MRTALAVIAGFLATVVLAVGTDFVLKSFISLYRESDPRLLLATLLYTQLYAVAGGYVTGRIARPRPMRAVSILAGIAWVLSLATMITAGSALPLWYRAASLILLIPCTLAGGWLAGRGRQIANA